MATFLTRTYAVKMGWSTDQAVCHSEPCFKAWESQLYVIASVAWQSQSI
ncbi:MAG: hypothetical protein ACI4M5_00625 [Christensenellales bacterium]